MTAQDAKKIIGKRIKEARIKKGYTQTELANMLPNEIKTNISKYENGVRSIPIKKLEQFASILEVSPLYLLGIDADQDHTPSNLVPASEFKRGILVGDIACGEPINQEEYEEVLLPFNADFALYCRGDSMINIGINDGDIVYIRRLDGFDELINGRITAVGIGDDYEYTLKRWFYNEQRQTLKLVPENDDYETKIFRGEELTQIHLLGVAVGFTSVL